MIRRAPRLRLWLDKDPDEKLFTAVGIGYNTAQAVPVLVRRREAANTRFVTVYDLTGNGGVQGVRVKAKKILVKTAEGERAISFSTQAATIE